MLEAVDIFSIIVAILCAAGWLGLFFYHKKTGRLWTFESVRTMQGLVVFLCVIVALIAIGIGYSKASGSWLEQATPEKTPAQVFLTLTSETTEEELRETAGTLDMYVIESSQHNHKTSLFYIVVDPSYLSHKEGLGVLLQVKFSQAENTLDSAELKIKTGNGTARCICKISADNTENYTVLLRSDWYAPKKVYHPETAQEAVQIAYNTVYPNGF